jgi:orn/DAP/arg decarboxylase 2
MSIVKEAALLNLNCDVANVHELRRALISGFSGDRIEATGPKNKEFLILAIEQNVTINVDNLDELKAILDLNKKINKKKVNILLRISSFFKNYAIEKLTRFGMGYEDILEALSIIKKNSSLNLLGFSFHVDTVKNSEKVIAFTNALKLTTKALEMGLSPKVIDIGGGFKVNYIESEDEWNSSITELKESFLTFDSLTWNNETFGMSIKNNTLTGTLNVYNFYSKETLAEDLDLFLTTKIEEYQNQTVADILLENMITLYIEPGKSLLDNLGISVAKVNFVKTIKNDTVIGLDMRRNDLVMVDSEVFLDPLVVSEEKELDEKKGVYFVGNLCLEGDLIYKRKIFIKQIPKEGDLVIFFNTAGYFMDFNYLDQDFSVTNKVAAIEKDNTFVFYKDELYNPIISKE